MVSRTAADLERTEPSAIRGAIRSPQMHEVLVCLAKIQLDCTKLVAIVSRAIAWERRRLLAVRMGHKRAGPDVVEVIGEAP